MEPAFCDLCQQSVPLPELDAGRARRREGRVVCGACLALLAPPAPGGPPSPALVGFERTRTRGALILVTVLACAALVVAVVAAGLILMRIEDQDRLARREQGRLAAEVHELRQRTLGQERLVARLVREELEGLRRELGNTTRTPEEELRSIALEQFEAAREELARELAEARLRRGESAEGETANGLAPAPLLAGLADLEDRLAWLEDQLSDLRLRRDLPPEPAPIDTGLPRPPFPGADGSARATWVASLTHEDPAVRVGALFALSAAGDRAAVRDVLPLLSDPHPYVRESAARLLERLDARPAVQALIGALDDEDVHVREAAVTALRGITRRSFGFDPRADTPTRDAAVGAWRDWWRGAWKGFLYGEGTPEDG